jgi:hypothetical protein
MVETLAIGAPHQKHKNRDASRSRNTRNGQEERNSGVANKNRDGNNSRDSSKQQKLQVCRETEERASAARELTAASHTTGT